MIKYYITTPEQAQGISAIKSNQEGCAGVTSFWWEIIDHPTNGQSAIVFRPDVPSNLDKTLYENGSTVITQSDLVGEQVFTDTDTEEILYSNGNTQIFKTDLVDHATLESAGWFPMELT